MKVSVIVVTLNSGESLVTTVGNICKQSFDDFEVIIKDGGSTDGSIENVRNLRLDNVLIFEEKDKGIYDAMNEAVKYASGDFVIFINAGDSFYSDDVLAKFAEVTRGRDRLIVYGDTFFESSKSLSKAPSEISASVCYRNIPCHQAIFYSKDILLERGFDTTYRIRADYEHFLWAYFKGSCSFEYLGFPVCSYEGGGFSESKANKKKDIEEYKRAVKLHIPGSVRFKNRLLLILTLHKVRGMLARNETTAKYYQKFKTMFQR